MDATPGRFRPRQRPLVSSPGPWSRLVLSHFRSRLPLLPAFHSSRCFPTGRFRLTAPEPVPRPTTLLSLAVRRCRPAACSGLHATPGSFRPSQSPLVSSPGPWSFLTAAHAAPVSVLTIFRSLHCFPSVAFTLRIRSRFQAYDTAFDRCAPVSSDRVLWCARHPCLVSGRVRAPWSSAQVPALLS